MKLSEISIKRPVTTLMLVFIVLILGFVSFGRLNVDLLPNINLPIAVVSTSYPGSGPKEVESIVTTDIENIMATVNNVKSIQSISSEGNSLIIMQFNDGTNMDMATLDMRDKLDLAKRMLPDGVSSPMVLKLDPNMMPIMSFGISQQGKEVSQLKRWVEDILKPRLERIDGVASVSISGGVDKEVKIIVDPQKLAGNGLSMMQVVNAIRMENMNAPGGIIGDGQYDLLVRTTGEFQSLEEIRNLPISSPTGATFLLKDIVQVEEGPKESKDYSKINGQDSLTISIQKESTANTVKVAGKVNKEIKAMKEGNPNIGFATIIDQSEFINRSISSVSSSAIIGGILAILILFLFLKNISPTLVIATSIPISIIATFILVFFAKITLNMISLGGLALGVGMLVDNSIVVLENIYRMRQEGLSRIEAARQGSTQVSMAIVASTLTTICVFLPIVFTQGIAAQIFKELALTVTFSLVASLVVALTLVPMLASKMLTNEDFGKRNKTLDAVDKMYQKVLQWALSHRKSVVFITAVGFIGSLLALPLIGTEFMPATDQGQINISVKMPKATRYEETVKAMQQVEQMVMAIPEVETVSSSIGGGMLGGNMGSGASKDSGSISLALKELKQRKRSTEEIGDEIRKKTQNIAGVEIQVSAGGSIMSGGMNMGGSPISIEIKGDNLDTLKKTADDIVKLVQTVEGTREVRSSTEAGAPELKISLDRGKASQYGINIATVSAAVQAQLKGTVATRYKVEGRELDVRVQVPETDSIGVKEMENLMITSPAGVNVPLKNIAKLEYEKGPVRIQHQDQTRVVTVSSSIKGRALGSIVKDIQAKMENYRLPEGYTVHFGGENQQLTETFSDLGLALILGVILVYMVMASQFESLLHPLVIMFAVPLGFTGAFAGLFMAGLPLSVPAILGMIVLAGVVVNNGIVLVDYINILRKEGLDRNESIIKAGPTRLRPILMTTLTTVLGLVPLALGIGEGSEMQMPLAITIIGGLSLSTVLTLVVVPVIYTLFDDLGKKFARKPGKASAVSQEGVV